MNRRRLSIRLFCLIFAVFCGALDAADIHRRDTLTGDWGGLRSKLAEKGISLEIAYTGEMVSVLSGGLKRKTVFLDNKDIVLSIDAGRLMGWNGAEFSLYILGNHGGSPSRYIGDLQVVSNIDAPNTWKIYEAWIQQDFFNGKLSLKAGLYDLNSEFDVMETAALFNNSSFGIGPDFSQSGLNGPSIFPTTSLGLRVRVEPLKGFYLQSVALDGVPGHPDRPGGTHVILNRDDGILFATESGYRSQKNGSSLKIALGVWYYTTRLDCLQGASHEGQPLKRKGNSGYYLLAERSGKRVSGFVRLGGAAAHMNRLNFYCGAGLIFKGLIPGRDDDLTGLALAHARNGKYFMDIHRLLIPGLGRAETVLEFIHQIQITPWFALKPEIQYIIHPGTLLSAGNAFNAGLRSEISF